jgi:hypothetical protein
MEALRSLKTSEHLITTWHKNPKDDNHFNNFREYLKPKIT